MNQSYATIKQNGSTLTLESPTTIPNELCNLSIDFVRTLRIPDDNQKYSLPPGLGSFPLKHVEDYKNLPPAWQDHGGVFLPMHQSEAMWLKFNSQWPFAIKIAAGKINAVSGDAWNPNLPNLEPISAHDLLARSPEEHDKYMAEYEKHLQLKSFLMNKPAYQKPDYIVAPKQPWLDGFNVGKGLIRQFVAMPLGQGYTVEEQLSNKAEHGGIQIIAYPMKAEYYQKILDERKKSEVSRGISGSMGMVYASGASASKGILRAQSAEMGLGAGGFMKQEIFDDPYGVEAWDITKPIRIFVHLLNSAEYTNITGEVPPTKPLSPKEYQYHNYPWFEYYSDGEVLTGSDKLASVDSIASLGMKKNDNPLGDNSSTIHSKPIIIGKKTVKNGNW